jgi:hypothetical protein
MILAEASSMQLSCANKLKANKNTGSQNSQCVRSAIAAAFDGPYVRG